MLLLEVEAHMKMHCAGTKPLGEYFAATVLAEARVEEPQDNLEMSHTYTSHKEVRDDIEWCRDAPANDPVPMSIGNQDDEELAHRSA